MLRQSAIPFLLEHLALHVPQRLLSTLAYDNEKAIQPKKKFGGRQEGSGRPKILFDPVKVEQIAMRCDSKADIALALGISYATLNRRQKDSESFESAIKRGQAKAKFLSRVS